MKVTQLSKLKEPLNHETVCRMHQELTDTGSHGTVGLHANESCIHCKIGTSACASMRLAIDQDIPA